MTTRFRAPDISVAQARADIEDAIRASALPDWVTTAWRGDVLEVTLRKGGTSRFSMTLRPHGDGAEVVETRRDVSLLHRAFVGQVSDVVADALTRAGFHAA